jgi:hypothetical protein
MDAPLQETTLQKHLKVTKIVGIFQKSFVNFDPDVQTFQKSEVSFITSFSL